MSSFSFCVFFVNSYSIKLLSFQYQDNAEEMRTIAMERRRKERQISGPLAALQVFREGVKYGLMFCCSICSQYHFQQRVTSLDKLSHRNDVLQLINHYYTEQLLPHLHVQLDTTWVCHGCKTEAYRGAMPALAMENNLAPTWLRLPELEQEEHEVVGLLNPLFTINDLPCTCGGTGSVSSTLFVPSITPPDSSSAKALLKSLHSRTSPYTLRPQVI